MTRAYRRRYFEGPSVPDLQLAGEWPSAAEQSEMHRRLHAGNYLTPTTRALIDVREATIPRYHQAEQTATVGIRNDAWPHRCAFVVGSVVQYGFSRELQAMAPPDSVIEIFSDEEKAGNWEPGTGNRERIPIPIPNSWFLIPGS